MSLMGIAAFLIARPSFVLEQPSALIRIKFRLRARPLCREKEWHVLGAADAGCKRGGAGEVTKQLLARWTAIALGARRVDFLYDFLCADDGVDIKSLISLG